MPAEPFSSATLRRALVIKLRHHGDVLLAAPVLSALRQFAPQCEIDALVYADTAPMLAGHPALAELHVIDRAWKRQGPLRRPLAEARLLSRLLARRYDLVLHLSVHTRGAWLTRLLCPRWSVAPRQRNKPGAGFWERSFTHLYPAQSHAGRHTVDTNLDSLRALGLEPLLADARVILVPGTAAEAKVAALLAEHGLSPGGFIHLHPTSRWLFKCWPAARVAALAHLLAARGWPLVFTAAPEAKERAMIAEIFAELGRLGVSPAPVLCIPAGTFFDFSGRLSLKELAALTARARLFVGVDSAPMHIAAAMGTPTVALFGPSGEREWGPWQVAQRIVTSTVHACRPCGRAGCNDSKISECLTTLPVEAVLAACDELLALPVAAPGEAR